MNKLKSSLILLLWFRLVPYSANNTHIKPPVCRLQPLPCSGHLHCVLFIYVVFCSLTLFSVQLHVFCSSQFLASSASLCISRTKAVTVFSRKFLKLLQVKLAMYWQRFFSCKRFQYFSLHQILQVADVQGRGCSTCPFCGQGSPEAVPAPAVPAQNQVLRAAARGCGTVGKAAAELRNTDWTVLPELPLLQGSLRHALSADIRGHLPERWAGDGRSH